LLLDGDSSHTAHSSVGLARELEIGLIWLPKRCPELNPVDHLWGHAKDEVCANHQEPSIEHLVDRFIRYIQGLAPEEARRKAGILSENFWLSTALSHVSQSMRSGLTWSKFFRKQGGLSSSVSLVRGREAHLTK
jgi:hypothetical protein